MRDRALPPPFRLGYAIDSLATGGAEQLVVTFAREAVRRPEIRLTVFVLSEGDTPFRRDVEALGVEVVALPDASLASATRFARLVGALRARSIEFLHAHLTSATILGANAAGMLGIPFAATVHNVRSSAQRVTRVRRALYRHALGRRSTHRIAVAQAVAEACAADARGRGFTVIPNAVPESAVWRGGSRAEARAALGLADGDLALVAVGLLIPQKAYPDLLDAFARVAARFPSARLLIAGGADASDYALGLKARAAGLGLGGRIAFLGARRDVPRLLAAADLFVSASHWEGAPVSLLEAMANGVPCVVTDVGDNRIALDGLGCEVTPPGRVEAFAEAVSAMLADPARRRSAGAAVRRRATERYASGPWADRLLAFYAERAGRRDWLAAPATPAAEGSAACAS